MLNTESTNSSLEGECYDLHFSSIVADAHNDVIGSHTMKGRDIAQYVKEAQTDLIRLKEGGVKLQIFSIFCNHKYGKGTAFKYANAMINALDELVQTNCNKISLAKSVVEIRQIVGEGKIAALFGVEGGHMIENNLDYLYALAERGMKYLTITWNNSTEWATSAADEAKSTFDKTRKGLSLEGRRYIRELNKLGVIADLSHAGEQTFYDVLEESAKPVLASHSNCYTLAPHNRNLKDDQLKAIAQNGGVIGINFYSGFIDSDYQLRLDNLLIKHSELVKDISPHHQHDKIYVSRDLFTRISKEEVDSIRPPLTKLIDHLDYIVNMAGIDHVCIGSDFDGAESFSSGMDDVSCYPLITKELLSRGYTHVDIKKILGENLLRILAQNEV
ncbi:membrane dipeptidase [Sphingobacterium phlebotomi]|uniref:Membrane dipeptidase n=1 Tax=Sphingobacterium phlebotomi TaxID=2605433 RepID=A0A5D4GU29_9SPHI|nr:dipeptidase [Sphingobacterium phlebotomi]TYR32236.1 membrane dipeptidase [Sphingobacterium phlebotomi]